MKPARTTKSASRRRTSLQIAALNDAVSAYCLRTNAAVGTLCLRARSRPYASVRVEITQATFASSTPASIRSRIF
jgi:hypothetical protein